MAVIGNDNYRPVLSPPKPLRGGAGWLSSNIAQLMVFLNGLILTIVAFATLNIFISEIVNESFLKTTGEVEEHLIQQYDRAEDTLKSLSYFVDAVGEPNREKVEGFLSTSSDKDKYFNAIYLLEEREGQWLLTEVFGSESFYKMKNILPRNYQEVIISTVLQQPQDEAFIAMLSIEELSHSDDKGIYTEPYILKSTIGSAGAKKALIGLGRTEMFLPHDWLEKRSSIHTVNVLDSKRGSSIYLYNHSEKNGRQSEDLKINNRALMLAGKAMMIEIGIQSGMRDKFLRKIPYLMLLFGLVLTLIGTMYVRSNQSQSLRLSEMNKELAHKNYELNQQMSERERLNQVIQKSARDNSAVINAVSDVIFELSVDEKIVFLNSTWKKVTGFDLEQSIGRNLFDLLYYQDQDEQKENFYQLLKGQKKPYRVYTRLRTSDGTFRSVELTMSMLRQDENKDLRVVGTITDVEERRRAERALSEAEKKYRAIVENAAAGIYQVTPEGQYLSANPALAKILGYDRPEDILRDITNVTQEIYVDQAAREKILREVVASKNPKNIELRIKRKDGTIAWANENIRPVYDDEGNLIFYEGSMEDIDQRKNAELALREAKIESDLANRAKSEFLANMSHELRTPLNSIIGFSDIIKGQAFGKIEEPKYLDYAENINTSGNSLLKVINEILDVSRIEAGERTLNEAHINISELVSSTLMLLSRKLKAADIEVHNQITDTSLGLIGETQAVKQILINLLSNAMKFSKGAGVVTLESEVNSKGGLRLSITDTGVGLTEAEIEKALSPFGQVETDLSRDKSGTGLGLTLVKSLMRLHGGELELVSQKGIGTTATLIFPEKRVTKVSQKDKNSKVEKADKDVEESFVERTIDE